MTARVASVLASVVLDRPVAEDFASAVLEGDPFVYAARVDEDPEAAGAVLGVATGRIEPFEGPPVGR